ncbi:MAG: DUF4915 domain-containing protein [Chthoniobacterales bacterium]
MAHLKHSFIHQDGQNHVLLASGFGVPSGGGLFAYNGEGLEKLDRLSGTGLFTTGDRLLRVLSGPETGGRLTELLVYDTVGVQRYYRLDGVKGVHDVAWDGSNFVVVSTGTNEIMWFSPSGERTRTWHAPGANDSWHLNNLLLREGKIFVSAFGRFGKTREWDHADNKDSGCIFDLETGESVIEGLSCPHNPRPFEDGWLVCNSKRGELLFIDSGGRSVVKRVSLGPWPRGVAVSDDRIFVGESANRKTVADGGAGAIAVICRKTWQVVERLPLPCQEVYDLVLVRSQMIEALRRGFATNPVRVHEQDRYALFEGVGLEPIRLWATGDRLPPDACRISLQSTGPERMIAGGEISLDVVVENLGGAVLVAAPPYPVNVSYKWFDRATGLQLPIEGLRTVLPRALPPRLPDRFLVTVQAPPTAGCYILVLTLVQEFVAWFDDLDEQNALRKEVEVVSTPDRCATSMLN